MCLESYMPYTSAILKHYPTRTTTSTPLSNNPWSVITVSVPQHMGNSFCFLNYLLIKLTVYSYPAHAMTSFFVRIDIYISNVPQSNMLRLSLFSFLM